MQNEEPIIISSLRGGLNRFEPEANENQAIEALDVWLRDGYVQRRPTFSKVFASAPYKLPRELATLVTQIVGTSFTNQTQAQFNTFAIPQIGGTAAGNIRLYIGCKIPFDGIEWHQVARAGNFVPANHAMLFPQYLDGNGVWQPIFGFLDTTLSHEEAGGVAYYVSLLKKGRVTWTKSQFANWAPQTVNGVAGRYWIVLDIAKSIAMPGETAPVAAAIGGAGGTLSLTSPGVRCLLLNPVNGLISTRTKGSQPVIVAGSDFAPKRANAPGGGLGFIRSEYEQTEIARMVEDEGTGICGIPVVAQWAGGTANDPDGIAATIVDKQKTWYPDAAGLDQGQWSGAVILTLLQNGLFGGGSSTVAQVFAGWQLNYDKNFENHRLRVVANPGPGGPVVGEESDIVETGLTSITVSPTFSTVLNGNETLEVRRPNAFVRTRLGGLDYPIYRNGVNTLPFGFDTAGSAVGAVDNNKYVHYEIFREAVWALLSGQQWCTAYDSVTGMLMMTNGENGLLEFDGTRLRRARALFDTTPGVEGADLVAEYSGVLRDNDPRLNTLINQGSLLRHTPPNGLYITDFNGRLVIANLKDKPFSVVWSGPGGANNIWPTINETFIRDSQNNPITGIYSMLDKLVVFTQTAIFVADQPDSNGLFFFRPISHSVGFTSHFAVCQITNDSHAIIVGISPGGISTFNGFEMKSLLDHWRRLLPYGVNAAMLSKACAAASMEENTAFFAVPSAGSDVNDRLIVWDWQRDLFWVWTAPYGGISAMTRDFDESGRERILFGHNDGHITTLTEGIFDGAAAVTGYARSKPFSLSRRTVAFKELFVQLGVMGNKSVSVTPYINRQDRSPIGAGAIMVAGVQGDALYGTDLYGTGTYASAQARTYKIMLPQGLSQGEMFEFEIRGSARWRYYGADVLSQVKGYKGM